MPASTRAVVPLGVAVLLACGALALMDSGSVALTKWVGIATLLGALPLVALARRQLGAAFAVSAHAKHLVTTGLYAKIPHPMYVFVDVALLGAILLSRRSWLLPLWAALVLVQAWEARREAAVLTQAFGRTYTDYRQRTWW